MIFLFSLSLTLVRESPNIADFLGYRGCQRGNSFILYRYIHFVGGSSNSHNKTMGNKWLVYLLFFNTNFRINWLLWMCFIRL